MFHSIQSSTDLTPPRRNRPHPIDYILKTCTRSIALLQHQYPGAAKPEAQLSEQRRSVVRFTSCILQLPRIARLGGFRKSIASIAAAAPPPAHQCPIPTPRPESSPLPKRSHERYLPHIHEGCCASARLKTFLSSPPLSLRLSSLFQLSRDLVTVGASPNPSTAPCFSLGRGSMGAC